MSQTSLVATAGVHSEYLTRTKAAGRKNYVLTIRREVRILVHADFSQDPVISPRGVYRGQIEASRPRPRYERNTVAPIRPNWRIIITALVSQSIHVETVGVHRVNLRSPGTIGRKRDHAPVG